jgi:hypothetical protein
MSSYRTLFCEIVSRLGPESNPQHQEPKGDGERSEPAPAIGREKKANGSPSALIMELNKFFPKHRTEHDAQDRRRYRKPVLRHEKTQDAEHQHDGNRERAVSHQRLGQMRHAGTHYRPRMPRNR